MATDFDAVVVGGGLVGLAIAKALLERGSDVTLLKRHARLGTEMSSRNSEVIHGDYYPPGSLRAKHCVEGRKLLYRFAEDTASPSSATANSSWRRRRRKSPVSHRSPIPRRQTASMTSHG